MIRKTICGSGSGSIHPQAGSIIRTALRDETFQKNEVSKRRENHSLSTKKF